MIFLGFEWLLGFVNEFIIFASPLLWIGSDVFRHNLPSGMGVDVSTEPLGSYGLCF